MRHEEEMSTDETRVTSTDRKLRELVGEHAARRLSSPIKPYPIGDEVVEPEGMSARDEAELESLLEMADPAGSGDEQAAIDRLVELLEPGRDEADPRG
jgi:hypothetical protein